jgi:hypothetical protein
MRIQKNKLHCTCNYFSFLRGPWGCHKKPEFSPCGALKLLPIINKVLASKNNTKMATVGYAEKQFFLDLKFWFFYICFWKFAKKLKTDFWVAVHKSETNIYSCTVTLLILTLGGDTFSKQNITMRAHVYEGSRGITKLIADVKKGKESGAKKSTLDFDIKYIFRFFFLYCPCRNIWIVFFS